jgi:arsenite oxidase small subunit
MKRREFVKLCGAAVAGVSASPELLGEGKRELHFYERVTLVDRYNQEPVRASSLEVGETYLFHYPFVSTPCFLIDLGRPVSNRENLETRDGDRYLWPGGAGPNRSVVAFSAICAHKMSHPAPSVSFINYRHGTASFRDHDGKIVKDEGVIYCCSEKSVYDPAQGARVLGGPAPQPLAAIALDYVQAEDRFYATGTIGGEMFDSYFETFGQRLVLDHQRTDIRRESSDSTELMRLREFCTNQIMCEVV